MVGNTLQVVIHYKFTIRHLFLQRLRTENRLLRQRIDNLETETATLADRLIQDQVKYAQQSEEIYTLRRAVSYTRRQSVEASGASSAKSDDLDQVTYIAWERFTCDVLLTNLCQLIFMNLFMKWDVMAPWLSR